MTESLYGTPPPINSPDNAEDTYAMATRFLFDVAGRILAVRYWGASAAIVTTTPFARIFSTAGVAQTAGTDGFSTNLTAQWNVATLAVPFDVTAGQTWDIVVGPRNRYAANTGSLPFDNGQNLTGQAGRFIVSAATPPPFPNTSTATWYGIDIIFEVASTTVTGGLADGVGVSLAPDPAIVVSAATSAGTGAAEDGTIIVSSGIEVASGVGAALDPSIELEGEVHLYKFGPCEPWDPIWTCNISLITGAAEVTGVAVQAASEILYQLSAQRFGLCNVKLRPCRKSCQGGFPWWSWWEYGSYPQPYWWNGTWYNLACGSCPGDSCSCIGLSETELPGPVAGITEVKLNGVVLTAGVDYRVDDYRKLVSLGDPWPYCQDLRLEDTEDNTWSVTAEYGEIVPVIGRMAVGELALEFVRYLLCDDACQLPFGVVDVSRQGISMTIQNTAELIKQGIINLPMCAMFIQASNPEHLTARAAVYDLDAPTYRAVGT